MEAIETGIKDYLKLRNPKNVVDKIVEFIKEQFEKRNANGVICGLSGGIDSALVAFLLGRALPKEKILTLFMGERDTHPDSLKHARLVAETLGVELREINITGILRSIGVYSLEPSPLFIPRKFQERYTINKYLSNQDEKETSFLKSLKGGAGSIEIMKGNAYLHTKHRIRAVLLYFYGEQKNYIVAGCCNKTEKLTGYFVKYGDSASDFDPIADLYKTQVRELGEFLGVPREIIEKPPSPDLAPGITDEFALQMPYEKIDIILYALEHNLESELKNEGISEKEIEYIKTLKELSSHMRELPPHPEIKN
ncbi:NAD(+) synthase [Caldisericum exile]|uniref:NH(3)-dependent NAD(+) synthetase n=1 Tax=Caldisericum exile (strain DSM 21853 / NBRC 104410 / AZM16c01) TaxID=511051 RepID=A0A7U6GD32_CALEA|nr:NAD(+) synthase [Caldisericum exile]BAL80154.1 NH(3)-dependent NAD(+) synthetase [Caldisericum exile AZM16c01]